MIEIRVPASTANLGSGTDCLGLALAKYLTVRLEPHDRLEFVFGKGFSKPLEPENNLILKGMERICKLAGASLPSVRATVDSEIPLSRGLGSSASAIVAGVYGANRLLGGIFDEERLIFESASLEGHPDNVVPCALGGFTVSMKAPGRVYHRRFEFPKSVAAVLAIPEFELATSAARAALPRTVSMEDALLQVSRCAFLASSVAAGDLTRLEFATEDRLFTPARAPLIPGFGNIEKAAKEAGALCAVISGAGPSALCFAPPDKAAEVAAAMERGFAEAGIKSSAEAIGIDNQGIKIIGEI